MSSEAVPTADLVSVVIPAYNAASWICETLQSVLAQTYRPLEVIVVDDGSTDSTAELVQKFAPRVRLIQQPNSGGCSSPRNNGLRASTGAFVTFFDADDLMCPDKIERQKRFLDAHADVSLVTADYRAFGDTGPHPQTHFAACPLLAGAMRAPAFDGVLLPAAATRILAAENYSIAGSPLYRRSVFDTLTPFDEGLLASEDFELAYRAARRGPTGIVDHVGFLRRLHGANMSRQTTRILTYKLKSRSQLLEAESLEPQRTLLAAAVSEYHISLAEQLGRDNGSWPDVARHVISAWRLSRIPLGRSAKALCRPLASRLGLTSRGTGH